MRPSSGVRESDVQRACLDLLKAEGIFAGRINSGSFSGSHKGKRWFVRTHGFGNGTADILAFVRKGEMHCTAKTCWCQRTWVLWLEIKAPSKSQSAEQKCFQVKVESEGHAYLVIRDVAELQKWLHENH